MKGLVVYHSLWGSCEKIAEAITRGISGSDHDVRAVAVEDIADPIHP